MSQLRTGLGLVALVSLSACELPTAAPIYDTLWETPARSTSIAVNTLLPSGVQALSDNSAFQVSVSPSSATISRSLGQDCGPCNLLNGLMAPKPAFSGGGSTSIALPSTVTNATLVHDTITVSINNGFTFDPIRPGANRGYLVTTVRNGSTVIGRDSVDGNTTAMPAGGTLTRKIPLAGTIVGANGIQVSTSLNSPAGDPAVIDMTRMISVTGSLGNFYVSAVQVNIANQNVSSSPTNLDLADVDEAITKRIGDGELLLNVNNPFNVTGNLAVNVTGAAMPIQKSVALTGGASTPRIQFTKAELLAMFGRSVAIAFNGNVNGSSVTVAPGQVVSVNSRLRVALTVGGQ